LRSSKTSGSRFAPVCGAREVDRELGVRGLVRRRCGGSQRAVFQSGRADSTISKVHVQRDRDTGESRVLPSTYQVTSLGLANLSVVRFNSFPDSSRFIFIIVPSAFSRHGETGRGRRRRPFANCLLPTPPASGYAWACSRIKKRIMMRLVPELLCTVAEVATVQACGFCSIKHISHRRSGALCLHRADLMPPRLLVAMDAYVTGRAQSIFSTSFARALPKRALERMLLRSCCLNPTIRHMR